MDLRTRYEALSADSDPAIAEMARIQLARLATVLRSSQRVQRPATQSTRPDRHAAEPVPSRWQHIPLVTVIAASGKTFTQRSDHLRTTHECGRHGSLTFVVWPESGRWYCHGCHETGDVVDYIAKRQGTSRKTVIAQLKRKQPKFRLKMPIKRKESA